MAEKKDVKKPGTGKRAEARKIVSKMTLEEKAALSSGKDFWQTKDIPHLGIPSMFLSDGPHGLRKQMAAADQLGLNESVKSTCFPTAVTMASGWDVDVTREMGRALGIEAENLDVGMLLGPGTNIKRSPLCGRNFEYYSEDPYLAGKMAASLIAGIQENAASACVKHFCCNSQETGRMFVDSEVDERALREIYLEPFEMAVKEGGVHSVMTSYNRLNGSYTNENEHIMRDILFGEWGFDGVVVTDWGGCNSRVAGYAAGNVLEMPGCAGQSCDEIVEAVTEGELSMEIVDENTERLLELVLRADEINTNPDKAKFDVEAHHLTAEKASKGGMVLLKNGGSLPLSETDRVCLIGDFADKARYQGGGSSHVNPSHLDSVLGILEAAEEKPFEYIGWERGFKQYDKKPNNGMIKKAVKLARGADKIVVFIGLDDMTESEGMERNDMKLPACQVKLIESLAALGKPIVGVLSLGSPVETDWDDKLDSLLCVYLTGQAGAKAVLDNLTGATNPSGKLAETWPIRLEDTPSYSYYLKSDMTAEYRESIFVGYRYYDKAGINPKYPFGYGLSYTTFEYSDLAVSPEGVTFTLKNTGTCDGAEVAQLYIGARGSRVFRAVRELKGFKKVFLKAGESATVSIPFDDYSFRWFNVKTNAWEIEDCDYEIDVAASSRDIRLTAVFRPEGGVAADTDYDEKRLACYYSGDVAAVPDESFEALMGRRLPTGRLPFYRKKRIMVDYNTSITQLRYARGWLGRLFGGAIRFAESLLRGLGMRGLANMLRIGVYDMPVRGLSRLAGGMFSFEQLDGMVLMFNGHFFKGLNAFFKGGKVKKQKRKAREEALAAAAAADPDPVTAPETEAAAK